MRSRAQAEILRDELVSALALACCASPAEAVEGICGGEYHGEPCSCEAGERPCLWRVVVRHELLRSYELAAIARVADFYATVTLTEVDGDELVTTMTTGMEERLERATVGDPIDRRLLVLVEQRERAQLVWHPSPGWATLLELGQLAWRQIPANELLRDIDLRGRLEALEARGLVEQFGRLPAVVEHQGLEGATELVWRLTPRAMPIVAEARFDAIGELEIPPPEQGARVIRIDRRPW